MVVSHRESTISSNIRAIIEQLNLNPVERRRLIERHNHLPHHRRDELDECRAAILVTEAPAKPARVTIGVYGLARNNSINAPGKAPGKVAPRQRQRIPLKDDDNDEVEEDNDDEKFKEKRTKDGILEKKTKDAILGTKRNGEESCPIIQEGIWKKTESEQVVVVCQVARKDSSPARATTNAPSTEFVTSSPIKHKEDLPELPSDALNHTAAHHRISVRPKNRRPPRRSTSHNSSSENGFSRIDTISETTSIDNSPGMEDSLEPVNDSILDDSPQHAEPAQRPTSILRKSSSRASRTSCGEHPQVVIVPKKPAFSPDSLDSPSHESAKSSTELLHREFEERASKLPRPAPRPSSEIILERIAIPRRRTASSCNSQSRLSKSPDSLESDSSPDSPKHRDAEEQEPPIPPKPVAARRQLLNSISKSSEVVCKSSDSLERLLSDDSIDQQRRRSSFDIRARRSDPLKNISKSFECFESLGNSAAKAEEKKKRATLSEINLCRSRVGSSGGKFAWKSSESFDKMAMIDDSSKFKTKDDENDSGILEMPSNCWGSSLARRTNHSSESSDNLDLEDCKAENRRSSRRSIPQVINSTFKEENGPRTISIVRQPSTSSSHCRLQKSSESSELGSTDTLDSERRQMKSSDSDETLDSLEKDLEQDHDQRENETSENVEKRDYKSSPLGSSEEVGGAFPWRQRSSSHELKDHNLDIHSLITYNISAKTENGNNEEDEKTQVPPLFPKKKPLHIVSSNLENNKIFSSLTNNLSKNEEDLQNMLNGNISEVSTTDTKSFKEKLIMFEKLGK